MSAGAQSPGSRGAAGDAGQPVVLGQLASAVHAAVLGYSGARVPLGRLREAVRGADLSMVASPEARERLAAVLDELSCAGLVSLPKGRALWERSARPPLPLYVTRASAQARDKHGGPPAEPDPVWHALLWWAPEFLATSRPTLGERRLLAGVQRLLAGGVAGRPLVPLRERSLELMGDEKALDSLIRGRLFGDHRLDLGLLAATRVAPALEQVATGPGPDVLLVENYATFRTLAAALAGHSHIGAVTWSAGNQVTQLLPQIAMADRGRIWYFGDLDARGLEIGAGAEASAAGLGLPPLVPSADLYALLLQVGVRARAPGRVPGQGRVRDAVAWLPAQLRDGAAELLGAGDRMAQEAVGVDLLATHQLPDPLR